MIQYIESNGKREYAIVPIELWQRLADKAEELDDEELFALAKAQDDGVRIPAAVVDAELAGDSSLRAWRKYRGLTLQALADQAGISKAFMSQIESGKRTGTIKVLSAISDALVVPIEMLAN